MDQIPIMLITEGGPEPLGVSVTASGVNVAVYSAHAEAIEFCLFEADGQTETRRIKLPGRTGAVFHGHITGVAAGALYGLRASGPYAPALGHRFNPCKLLVDPYALALDRPFVLHAAMFGFAANNPDGVDHFDETDSAPVMPKAIVTASPTDRPPPSLNIPWSETVIYELHVRGFTRAHPDISEALRGTFAGLAHPAAIAHLKALGVTTVELMPASAWIDERHLGPLGLTNYWGYNPVAYLAPDPRLAPGGWAEVRAATDALAAAGIECLLDVVFNHTGEGDALGPTLSLRGLDNASYYHLPADNLARYIDDSGTGNTLALHKTPGLRLTMDALRAWRNLGGISGFRFDLATVLGRRPDGFDPAAPLLAAIDQDPDLRDLKLIAEPWDCGPGGYQLGQFPAAWGEWNDRFRDSVRSFWRGDALSLGVLAGRLAGSEDLFPGRRPSRSVNFVVAHDGFTLADLVAFSAKHNLANGEHNRDGAGDNRSWNNGVEGPASDPQVLKARLNDQRALLATLMLARGTPMLSMGAEMGHSQAGNNNAYAQDTALSWLNWGHGDADLLAFTAKLAQIRRDHPALRADRFLTGRPDEGEGVYGDVEWRRADGTPLATADWDDPHGQTLVMVLSTPAADALDRVAVIIHRGPDGRHVLPPEPRDGFTWTLLADSADVTPAGPIEIHDVTAAPRSVLILAEAPAPNRRPRGVDPEILGRLAKAAGLSPEWWTVEGEHHQVTPDTQRALLAAMRLPADTSQRALESLHGLAQAHDRRALPFTLAGRADQPMAVSLACPPGGPPLRTWLSIEDEAGQVQRLRVDPRTTPQNSTNGRDGRVGRSLSAILPPLPAGRYQLRREDQPDIVCRLTIAPETCYAPQTLAQRRLGLSVQLYSVTRPGDQGIGDFTTLGELGERSAAKDVAVLGFNPLHALFSDRRELASPYYPSDRRFLDPIYLDLAKVPFAEAISDSAQALSAAPLIDYSQVWALKAAALETSFAQGQNHPGFAAFIAAGGQALADFGVFESIIEAHPGENWRQWPNELRDAHGSGVKAFAAAHHDRVRFHQYLQWLCEGQFAEAAARAGGLSVGFCRDLAIGAAPDGGEAWSHAHLLVDGVSIGAPPDILGPQGQIWGLPPLDPHRLLADGCRSVAELFRSNMRHTGALRVDHVMGLTRLFWIPHGADGSQGAYVAYPLEQLLAELALESERAKCLVIGEDLGTVPPGLRETLASRQILSYRALPFERDGLRYRRPKEYPALAFACAATHDLPTLAGWWEGLDIDERVTLGLFTAAEAEQARLTLLEDKRALVEALAEARLVKPDVDLTGELTTDMLAAIHAYMAQTPSILAVAQLEDLAGERIAVNLPGTDRERPNWRRRITRPLDQLLDSPTAQAILRAMREQRGG